MGLVLNPEPRYGFRYPGLLKARKDTSSSRSLRTDSSRSCELSPIASLRTPRSGSVMCTRLTITARLSGVPDDLRGESALLRVGRRAQNLAEDAPRREEPLLHSANGRVRHHGVTTERYLQIEVSAASRLGSCLRLQHDAICVTQLA